MKIFAKTTLPAVAALFAFAGPSLADQFLISVSEPFASVNERVLETLKIEVVDGFSHDGQDFVVVNAPNEAYLETLFNSTSVRPLSLQRLAVDWSGEAMAQIDTAQRLKFGAPVACGFCS